ncbi:hypothetical protein DIU36_16185 [Mucilaginibacter rubeus]|nr:hypothetical protein DIU36_16185 [Mucilaginibacter rubeus]
MPGHSYINNLLIKTGNPAAPDYPFLLNLLCDLSKFATVGINDYLDNFMIVLSEAPLNQR